MSLTSFCHNIPLRTKPIHEYFARSFFLCSRGCEYQRGMYSHQMDSPNKLATYSGSGSSKIFSCIRTRANTMGHSPSTAGTFRKKFRKDSGKTPETLSEFFLEFPSRVRLGSPKSYISRHLRLPEHFQNSLPLSTAGDASFQKWFRRGPLRAGHGIPSSTEGISDTSPKCIRANINSPRFFLHVLP